MRCRFLAIMLAFMLLATAVSAVSDVEITIEDVSNSIYPGKDAVFDVVIKNTGTIDDIFVVKANEFVEDSDFASEVMIIPNSMKIAPSEKGTFNVKIKTKLDARPNKNYKMSFSVISSVDTGFRENFELTTRVYAPEEIVEITPQLLEKIEAKDGVPFRFRLLNTVDIPLDRIDVYITSDVEAINDKKTISLSANQESIEEFIFDIPATTLSKEYTLNVRIYDGSKLIGEHVEEFLIEPNPDVRESISSEGEYFVKVFKLEMINTGNEIIDDKARIGTGYFQKMFGYGVPAEDSIERVDGTYYFTWDVNLMPGDTFESKVIVDYRPLVVSVLVIGVFAFLAWFLLSRGIRVRKKLIIGKTTDSGSNIKIMINLKNTSGLNFKNVEVIELLPSYLHDTEEYSTLKPRIIRKGKAGKKIRWDIENLKKGEDMIITYTIKSRVQFIGSITLPATMVHYMTPKGEVKRVRSNDLNFTSDMLKKRGKR